MREEKRVVRESARQRITELFQQAASASAQERADRLVRDARRLSRRSQVRFTTAQRRLFCRKCGAFWAGKRVRIRVRQGRMVYVCSRCKTIKRFPWKGKKS
jgi:RNase P subunit RPR2